MSGALGPRAPLRVSGRPAGGPGPVCRGGTDGPALARESRASQKPKGNSGGKVPATGDTVWCARRPAAVSGARDTRTWGSPAVRPSRPSRGRTGGRRRWAPAGERAPRTHDPRQGPQRPRARAWTTAPNAGRGGGSGWPASPDLWGLSWGRLRGPLSICRSRTLAVPRAGTSPVKEDPTVEGLEWLVVVLFVNMFPARA